ncbi:MAG: hypothetical protein R3D78_11730 [Paracoccaceae bacterium]
MIHTDMGFPLVIGADCTIGHKAIAWPHDRRGQPDRYGRDELNGARIGRGCSIGAGALVTEGKEIPMAVW